MKTYKQVVEKLAKYAEGQYMMGSMNHPLHGSGLDSMAWVLEVSPAKLNADVKRRVMEKLK